MAARHLEVTRAIANRRGLLGQAFAEASDRHGWCAGLLEPGAKRTSADAVLSDDRRAAATVRAGGV